eukprot:TRINITY_DN2916_c0_g1_i1.p1 TRINITY_DN2916_c0_g1~~TRINITY_DN2916_c0_g1_i1.p1  ORF type:complete len:445 (-),score=91.87 TRINITY_DN2916_c0_g1_i1:43-1377(-)
MRVPGLTNEDIASRNAAIRTMYYILYCSMFAFSFLIAPFAYFFYEEVGEDVKLKHRIWAGLKYTIFLILIITVLLIIGLFLNGAKTINTNDTNAKQFIENLFDLQNKGQAAIEFALSCLALLGYVMWISYAAYGLSAFPFSFLKRGKRLEEEKEELHSEIVVSREKKNLLKQKYLSGRMSRRDERNYSDLEMKEKNLVRRHTRVDKVNTCYDKFSMCLRPCSIIFGILFFLISLVIITSFVLTNINKISNSVSHYVLKYPSIFNPVDTILTFFSRYFPIDYVIFSSLVLYIFLCIFAGIIGIGVRFFWLKMFNVQRGTTAPQGLLAAAVICMLCILAFNFELLTLAPQYSSFGSQTFYNSTTQTVVKCSIQMPSQNCTMTQLASLVNRINVRMSFFSVVFYYGTWVFIGFWLIGFVYSIFRKRKSMIQDNDSDEEDRELYGNRN